MGGFVSSAEGLAESPENCLALAHQLMNEYPPHETGDLRSALTKRYLPPGQYTRLLAHSVNGLLERLFGEEVDRQVRRQKVPHRTEAHLSELFGESPNDYALRKAQGIAGAMPDSAWETMARRSGRSVQVIRRTTWSRLFYEFLEKRLS